MSARRTLSIAPAHPQFDQNMMLIGVYGRCQVCGDKAYIFNYGALSCASCKTFFRRHGFRYKNIPQCEFYGNCEITTLSRRMCTACRFAKCLAIGMNPDRIRKEDLTAKNRCLVKFKRQDTILVGTDSSNVVLPTLGLLSNDSSTLSTSNWTLLSNVIHAFDIYSPLLEMQTTIDQVINTPGDTQSNLERVQNVLGVVCQSVQSSISSSADFRIMTTDEQSALVNRNIFGIWAFYSMFVCFQCNLFGNETNKSVMKPLYGMDNVEHVRLITLRLDHDLTLVKLILMVLSFSSNCFAIDPTQCTSRDSFLFGTFRLFGSQNAYVEVMWKYMLYRYGYFESAKRFCALIKIMLDEIRLASSIYDDNKVHQELANQAAEQIKESLTITGNTDSPLWGKEQHFMQDQIYLS